MERIFEHLPNWFTFTCWAVGAVGFIALVLMSIASKDKERNNANKTN